MKELPIYKIEPTTKLNEFDKLEIKEMTVEKMDEYLDGAIERMILDQDAGEELSREKAAEYIKFDVIEDFEHLDADYEFISVNQEDEPEQYNFEKSVIMEWAKN